MPDTPEKRIAQLESIVNELTARIAGDPGNADLPPLLTSAQAELAALKASTAAGTTGATGAPAATPAAVIRPKLAVPPAKSAAAPAAKSAAAPVSKRVETGVSAAVKAQTRPSPAVPRPAPTNPALTKAPATR